MKCYHASALGSYQANGKICQDIINCHSKPGSVESAESSEESKSIFLSLVIIYEFVLHLVDILSSYVKVIICFNCNRFI